MSIRAWECRTHAHLFTGSCWHARCNGCGAATAFDFTAEEARAIAEAGCSCGQQRMAL